LFGANVDAADSGSLSRTDQLLGLANRNEYRDFIHSRGTFSLSRQKKESSQKWHNKMPQVSPSPIAATVGTVR
jgi:hypothetical protein